MTVIEQINRIKTNISNAYDVAESKGATMPLEKNSDNLANTIQSITTGGGGNTFGKFHIEQIIFGNTCELAITEIGSEQANNYMIGQIQSSDSNELYIYD